MKLKGIILGVLVGLTVYTVTPMVSTFSDSIMVHAIDDFEEDGDDNDGYSVGDALKGMADEHSMSGEDLAEANTLLQPITSLLGSAVGIIIALVSALIFLITALDLVYICVPFTRSLLYVDGQSGSRGGMGMGMGMGGMSMGMQQQSTHERRQLVSDEAVQCAVMMGNNQQQGYANMGYPGGGMGAMQSQPQNAPLKSVLITYFKKRVFFLILFAICAVMLTSSIFIGTGINLAEWFTSLIEMLNGSIPN